MGMDDLQRILTGNEWERRYGNCAIISDSEGNCFALHSNTDK